MRLRLAALLAALAVGLGCGKEDPNKNLKPIDPNTPPPQIGTETPGGEKKTKNEGQAPVVK